MKEIYKNPLVRVVTVEIRHQVCVNSLDRLNMSSTSDIRSDYWTTGTDNDL